MKTATLPAIFLCTWGVSTASALDFTPRQETQMIDTYPIHYLSFPDGDQRVGYGPPNGWKYSGGGNKLSLADPKNGQATFTVLPTPKAGPFTLGNFAAFKAFAKTLVPTDGQLLSFAEGTGLHLIGNRESYTADLSYGFYGKKFSLRVTFVNLGPSFLQIVSTAPAMDFESFNSALESTYCSWHWMRDK